MTVSKIRHIFEPWAEADGGVGRSPGGPPHIRTYSLDVNGAGLLVANIQNLASELDPFFYQGRLSSV